MSVSLADIAGMDVSEVAEVRFSALPKGSYEVKITEASLNEGVNAENEQRFIAEFNFEVVEAVSLLDKKVDAESLIGRKHTEKQYIVPEKAEEGIGLIRSFISDMGLPNEGGLEQIITDTKGEIIRVKVSHRKDKNDPEQVYTNMKIDAKANEKAKA